MSTLTFCEWTNENKGLEGAFIEKSELYSLEINSCYRETILDAVLPILFFIVSYTLLSISRFKKRQAVNDNDYIQLPVTTIVPVFQRSFTLLIVTLLEISAWAFVFAWRLESIILESSKKIPSSLSSLLTYSSNNKIPPLYQVVDPGLAFLPRIYILVLIIKSFTTPVNPRDPSRFSRYKYHFLIYYSITLVSAFVRVLDYYFTDNKWYISSAIEKSFSIIDLSLCLILWFVIMTAPSELNQGELLFEDDDDGVIVHQDGTIVRNGRMLSLESTSSLLSSLSFSWMNSLLETAFKTRLTAASLWALPLRQRAKENHRLFTETKKPPSTRRVTSSSIVYRIYLSNKTIILFQFVTAIAAVLFHYANPYFLKKILGYIQEHHEMGEHKEHIKQFENEVGYMYCLALFCCNVVSTLVASQTLLWGRRWHVTIVHMLNTEIYTHALRLKTNHLSTQKEEDELDRGSPEDEIEESEETDYQQASLMSQDTERLAELASYLHIFYTCPLEIVTGVLFLYNILGNSFLAGLIVMVVALPSTHYISRRLMVAQSHLTEAKSWRLRLIREFCKGIKTIKFLASERRWEQAIGNARDDELVKLIKLYTQNTILGLIWFATPVFVTTISFAWYTLVEKKTLDASTAFVSIVLFGMLRDPLNVMPQALMAYSDAKISLNHIATFLNTPIKAEPRPVSTQHANYDDQAKVGFESTVSTFEWVQQAPQQPPRSAQRHRYRMDVVHEEAVSTGNVLPFRIIIPYIEFPTGQLSVVIGPAQSGKTSLIAALTGDMTMIHGEHTPALPSRFHSPLQAYVVDPKNNSLYLHKVAYVSQKPWIEHGTIRENILFSESWDDTRYRSVLHQCDLLRDLSLFDNGDLTLTADKEVFFSERLKHKISLARAVYSRAKTVIIDDIFTSFEEKTANFIFEHCIRGNLMGDRTVILTATTPSPLWDAQLLVNLAEPNSNHEGSVDFIETDPDKIGQLIKRMSDRKTKPKLEPVVILEDEVVEYDDAESFKHQQMTADRSSLSDVIDVLFEPSGNPNLQSTSYAAFEDDTFDEASIIPESIHREEEREVRSQSRRLAYATYYYACGGWQYWFSAVLFTLLARAANISESYWLKEVSDVDLENDISTLDNGDSLFKNYVLVYLTLCLITVVCNFIRTVIQYRGSLRASNRLFLDLLRSVCHAPLQFFDITPVSQIMSRFSKDMETIDSSIGWHVNFLLQTVFGVFGVVLTIGFILPEFFIASVIAALLYFYIGIVYIRASRELKKLNSESRPPIFNLFTDTLLGLSTIRIYGEEWNMMKKMFNRLDDNMRPFYTLWNTNRWLFVRVELLGTFLSLFIGASLIYKVGSIDAGLAGIALTFSTSLLEYVYWLMRQSTTVDMHFEAVEHINEYMEMPQEPPSIVEGSRPPAAWPTNAAIQVRDLVVSFSNNEADAILKHVSFNIFPSEKIALVGRANGEKLAFVSCLFRFMEPLRGSIKIDGVNIAWIGVEDLRSRITFISKDSWLLSGTVRSNLDPFGDYDDYALWQVLYRVLLARPSLPDPFVTTSSTKFDIDSGPIHDLDKDIGKDGCRLSVLERQLLCIARALLQDCTKLVIIEEADLNFDEQEIIYSVIEREFEDSTLIVIPYALRNVVNYDKIMVFDQGNLVEFDSPIDLLNKQHSLLQSLCEKAGILDDLTLDTDIP